MRVLLIDDHALFRVGLQQLLQRLGIEVIAATGDCREGIDLAVEQQPDVVLLDMRMPDMYGIDVLKELRSRSSDQAVAILTTSREEGDLIESLQNGAQGYLLKEMEPDDLVKALGDISSGTTVVAPELTGVLAKVVQGVEEQEANGDVFSTLTPREREILCHLVEGQSNKLIARALGISDGTVKLHVKGIMRKLNVHSPVEAAVLAVERSLCVRGAGGGSG
jgi:two-component system nitrate/nitrite response regulator NarL